MTESNAESASVVRPSSPRRFTPAVWLFTGLFVLFSYLAFELPWPVTKYRAEMHILLPALQVLGTITVLRYLGLPRSLQEFVSLVLCTVALLVVTWALKERLHRWFFLQTLALSVRIGIISAWLASTAGVVLLAEAIRRQTMRWHRWSATFLKLGGAAAFVTLTLESTAWLLEPTWISEKPLPELQRADGAASRLIAAIGGSTMLGFPYAPDYGIAEAAVGQLRSTYPDTRIELKNLAVTGANLAQAVSALSQLDRCPEILLVYSGHNEFFKGAEEMSTVRKTNFGALDDVLDWSPTFRIINPLIAQYQIEEASPEGARLMVGDRFCPNSVAAKRLHQYSHQLEQLLQWARANRIAVVFCSPAADEADFEPNLSSCDNCSNSDRKIIQSRWTEIRRLQQQSDDQTALDMCLEAIGLFHGVAELHFRAGECLRRLGRAAESRLHFERARDLDGFPIRATTSFIDGGLKTAAANDALIVNSAEVLRQHSSDGILGNEFFLDGVHPNLRAIYVLGQNIADTISLHDLLLLQKPARQLPRRTFAESLQDANVDKNTLSRAYETTATVLKHYTKFRPYDDDARTRRSVHFAKMSKELRDDTLVPGEGGTESLGGMPYTNTPLESQRAPQD